MKQHLVARPIRSPVIRIGTFFARGSRVPSAGAAIRAACYLGTSPEFWLNLQSAYDLSRTLAQHRAGDRAPGEERAA